MLNDYLLPYKPTLTRLNPLLPLSPLRNRLVPLDHNVNEEREELVDELAQNGTVLKQATKLTFGILILHRFVDSLSWRSPFLIAHILVCNPISLDDSHSTAHLRMRKENRSMRNSTSKVVSNLSIRAPYLLTFARPITLIHLFDSSLTIVTLGRPNRNYFPPNQF